MGAVSIFKMLLRPFAIEQIDCPVEDTFPHLFEGVHFVVGEHAVELGFGFVDQRSKLASFLDGNQTIRATG
jgi:hypothetical protein